MESFLKIKNKKTIIFLISVGISTFMWLLIKLSKEYEIAINVPINYVNAPTDKMMLTAADSIINVNIIDNGFDLLGESIMSASNPITLDVNKFRKRKQNNNKTKYFILSNTLYDNIKQIFGSSTKITEIKPDSLILSFEKLMSKKVRVTPHIKIKLAPQYQLAKPINILPDSIILYGSFQELQKIDSVNTNSTEIDNLENDIDTNLELILPSSIKSETKKVHLNIDVEKFTEASLAIPIQTDFDAGTQIKIFPKNIQIKYAISLENFHSISADQFKVFGIQDSLATAKLNIVLVKHPKNIRVIDYSPKMAEFIIIK